MNQKQRDQEAKREALKKARKALLHTREQGRVYDSERGATPDQTPSDRRYHGLRRPIRKPFGS